MIFPPDDFTGGTCAHCGRKATHLAPYDGARVCHPIPVTEGDSECLRRLIVGREPLGALIGNPRPRGLSGLTPPGGGR